jgi:hypothetical protein
MLTKVWAVFFHGKSLDKNLIGLYSGPFSLNSSGHPVQSPCHKQKSVLKLYQKHKNGIMSFAISLGRHGNAKKCCEHFKKNNFKK